MRILIADDHELIRQGLRTLLEEQPGWQVCGEAENGEQAVQLARELEPDLVVMDLAMPGLGGLEATREIRKARPATRVVILTAFEAEILVEGTLAAGASGYVLKTDAAQSLVRAVEAAMRGEPFFSGQIASVVLRGFLERLEHGGPGAAATVELTPRERRVLRLVAEGKTNKQVASRLGVSVKTVDSHRTRLMAKLGLHSVVDLVRYAIRNHVVEL